MVGLIDLKFSMDNSSICLHPEDGCTFLLYVCHCLALVCVCTCVCVCVCALSCPTLCNSMDYRLPGSSVHGISQARILEWVAILFSKGSSQARDPIKVCQHCRQIRFLSEPPGKPFCSLSLFLNSSPLGFSLSPSSCLTSG